MTTRERREARAQRLRDWAEAGCGWPGTMSAHMEALNDAFSDLAAGAAWPLVSLVLERWTVSVQEAAEAAWLFGLSYSDCDPKVTLAIRIGREVDRWFAAAKRGER